MGEGQWRIDDALAGKLHALYAETEAAVERNNQEELTVALHALAELVRSGERLDDDHLGVSDEIVPPVDLTLADAHALIGGDLIPELP